MTWSPERRLLGLVGLLTLFALLQVAVPVAGALLAGATLLALCVAALDWWLSRREPVPRLVRRVPERLERGEPARIALELENPSSRARVLDVLEAVPDDVGASRDAFHALSIEAHGRAQLSYDVLPIRRGDRPLGSVVLFVRSRLGLWRRRVAVPSRDVLRVASPVAALLRREALDPRRLAEQLGARPVRRRGQGFEFESLRDYVPGDDPRRLDWAASARRGRPVVRLFEHERHHTVVLALDASRLMASEIDGRSKLDHAVDAALVLAHAGLATGDRVGVCVFDREVRGIVPPRRHRRELGGLVDFLRPVEPRSVEANFQALARTLAARQRQRALLVVFTDFVEADGGALQRSLAVLGRRHRLLFVALRDPAYDELDPRAPGPDAGDEALYRRLVLADLLLERERTLLGLRRAGLQTLDVKPRDVTARVLNRYLMLRYGPGR